MGVSRRFRRELKKELRRIKESRSRVTEAHYPDNTAGGLSWFGFGTGFLRGRGPGVDIQVSLLDGEYTGHPTRQPDGQMLPYKPGTQRWHSYINKKAMGKVYPTMGDAQYAAVAYYKHLKNKGLPK